jgi:hypothetical protein
MPEPAVGVRRLEPSPGSPSAVKKGCTCPVLDNNHGKGCYEDGRHFWVNGDCPLHGRKNRSQADASLLGGSDEQ